MIPTPFSLHVADPVLDDLRQRLAHTRWPDEAPGQASSTGRSVVCMHALAEYWRTDFDWRAQEAALNRFRPFTVPLGGIDLHRIPPAGLAAWIVEKFRSWTDNDGDPARAVPRDEMLANITLYWATGAIGSSFWPYYARLHREWPVPAGKTVDVPMGYVEFPREILHPPRSVAARQYSDIRRWTTQHKGGHFAALEQPEVLAHEIRAFFRPLRAEALKR